MSKTIQEMHQKKQGKTSVYIYMPYIYICIDTRQTQKIHKQTNDRQKLYTKIKPKKNRHTQKEDDFPFPVWWDMLVPWRVNKKMLLDGACRPCRWFSDEEPGIFEQNPSPCFVWTGGSTIWDVCLAFLVRMPGQKIGLTMLTTNFWSEVEDLEVSLPIISNGSFSCSLSFAPASGGIFDLPAFHLFFGVFRSHRGLSEGTPMAGVAFIDLGKGRFPANSSLAV